MNGVKTKVNLSGYPGINTVINLRKIHTIK